MQVINIDALMQQVDHVIPTYVGILNRETISQMINDYLKHDRFNILKPRDLKSNKYIDYWTAITYYDKTLSGALIESPDKWYGMICDEIKESLHRKTLSNTNIARYYEENF